MYDIVLYVCETDMGEGFLKEKEKSKVMDSTGTEETSHTAMNYLTIGLECLMVMT